MRTLCSGLILAAAFCVSSTTRADDFKLEPGFTLLFNGKDLSGWKAKTGGEALDGKAEAYKGRFKASNGIITIDPKVKGDVRIETTKKFEGDVHIKFDFKPDAKCNNDLFLRGMKFDISKANMKSIKDDEWQSFEIILKGDMAEFKSNGASIKKMKAKPGATTFEIRAEFGAIELKNVRYKENP